MARRSVVRGALALVLALTASGCWLQPDADAGHTRSNPLESTLTAATVSSMTQAWTTPLDTGPSAPVVRGDRAYVTYHADGGSSPGPRLAALRTDTGAVAWDDGQGTGAPNESTDGPTFVGDELWVVNRAILSPDCPLPFWRVSPDGSEWSEGPPTAFLSTPVTAGDTVAYSEIPFGPAPGCGVANPRLTVRDRSDESVRFTVAGSFDDSFQQMPGTPAVADGRVYVAVGDRFMAFPAEGCGAPTCAPLWTVTLPTPEWASRAVGTPVAAGGRVFLTNRESRFDPRTGSVTHVDVLTAYDADDGTVLWRDTANAIGPPAVARDRVVYVARRGAPGAPPASSLVSSPAACGSCAGQWRSPIGTPDSTAGSPVLAPIVAGDVTYVPTKAPVVGGTDGQVLAFAADGCGALVCEPLATVTTPGTPVGLAVSGGRLFVSTAVDAVTGQGGALTAFGLPRQG